MTRKNPTDDETKKYSPEEEDLASILPVGTCLTIFNPTMMKIIPMPPGTKKVLGREKAVDIAMEDTKLSRQHAQFVKQDDKLILTDLGSTNGTFVNGERIYSPTELSHGDEIRVGNSLINVIEVLPGEDRQRAGVPPREKPAREEFGEVIIKDPCMLRIYEVASRIASSFSSVIVLGETGVGKEVIARHIHARSPFSKGPFVAINCSAIPENIAESELFGHEKGAFTGAAERKIGTVESADGGTLFLDEVTDLPAAIQPKLLRFLDHKTFTRLGGTKEVEVDVRLICATNKDMEKEVKRGNMRQDLYFRLNQFTLYVPPLRARPLEIAALAEHFIAKMAKKSGKKAPALTEEAVNYLMSTSWPGNIRQLRNVIERAVVFCEGSRITDAQLIAILREEAGEEGAPRSGINEKVQDFEMKTIVDALKACNANQTKAARMLGITRRTLIYRMKKYNIR
jgi:two-component system response regulator AtoC